MTRLLRVSDSLAVRCDKSKLVGVALLQRLASISALACLLCAVTLTTSIHILSTEARAEDSISQEAFKKAMADYLSNGENVDGLVGAIDKHMKGRAAKAEQEQERARAEQIEKQFANPVVVDIGSSPTQGPKDAPITIIEFSDFQCPYCSRGRQRMEEIAKAYPGKIRFVFKNLPLGFHPEAEPAALAALAAGAQGKFWEMHNLLFDNQASLGASKYPEWAQQLGLDVELFKKQMASDELKQKIKADVELASSVSVSGTPAFLINGVLVSGAQPISEFRKIIDRWLQKIESGK